MLGDGYCDDSCNHPRTDFNFDEGDCCLEHINDVVCHDCICFEDCSKHPSKFDNQILATECYNPDNLHPYLSDGLCLVFEIGNGVCNGMCNNHFFDFDGGDCCLATINSDKCDEESLGVWENCICYEDCERRPTIGPDLRK